MTLVSWVSQGPPGAANPIRAKLAVNALGPALISATDWL